MAVNCFGHRFRRYLKRAADILLNVDSNICAIDAGNAAGHIPRECRLLLSVRPSRFLLLHVASKIIIRTYARCSICVARFAEPLIFNASNRIKTRRVCTASFVKVMLCVPGRNLNNTCLARIFQGRTPSSLKEFFFKKLQTRGRFNTSGFLYEKKRNKTVEEGGEQKLFVSC